MNLRQTTEVAVHVSAHAEALIRHAAPLPVPSLHAYWKISRTRLKYWLIGFEADNARRISDPRRRPLPLTLDLSRQILTAELLTRVWTVVLVTRDEHLGIRDSGAIARRVFYGHQEARRQVLSWVIQLPDARQSDLSSLDRLRRRVEVCTDLLLAPFVDRCNLNEFAFDEQRVRDYARTPNACREIMRLLLQDAQHSRLRNLIPPGSSTDGSRRYLELGLLRTIDGLITTARQPMLPPAAPKSLSTAAGECHTQAAATRPVARDAAEDVQKLNFSRILRLRNLGGDKTPEKRSSNPEGGDSDPD